MHPETWGCVHLDDGAAGLAHGLGDVGREEVDAATSSPTTRGGLLGDLDVLFVRLPGSVDRVATGGHVAGGRELDEGLGGRHVVEAEPLLAEQLDRGVVDLDPREHLLVPDPASRIRVRDLDEVGDRVLPSPITCAGTRSATATIRPPTTSTR